LKKSKGNNKTKKEKEAKRSLQEILEQNNKKREKEEMGKMNLLKTIAKKNIEIKKEVKVKEKQEKIDKKKKMKKGLEGPKEEKKMLKITLNNIVKLKSAADYNVTFRSESAKKKKPKKLASSKVQTPFGESNTARSNLKNK
jgi:hypothetical protein